jgi:hypothetical protein
MIKNPGNGEALALFGCFSARKLLEAGCIALLSHIDPPRLLILREFQLQGAYELGERHPASIDWKNDVVSEKKSVWKDSVSPEKFVRSLLGGHLGEIVWLDAIRKLESLPEGSSQQSTWVQEMVTEYVARLETQGVVAAEVNAYAETATLSSFRLNTKTLFSTLSKGVHLEFVIDQANVFDAPTILENMQRTVKILSQLAFVSHLMDCTSGPMPITDAAGLVLEIEDLVKVEGAL